jgi:hypothetical protein
MNTLIHIVSIWILANVALFALALELDHRRMKSGRSLGGNERTGRSTPGQAPVSNPVNEG